MSPIQDLEAKKKKKNTEEGRCTKASAVAND